MTAYTATAAATIADVTVDTVRGWARMGAVQATKVARRWSIDAASLAYRISLGIRRTRKANSMDLEATYTYTPVGGRTRTITPKIRTRTTADGEIITSIRHIIPLLADKIDAITDEGDRAHTLEILSGASITLSDTAGEFFDRDISTRDSGRIATTYVGTKHVTTDDVLDLAEAIRTHLDAQ